MKFNAEITTEFATYYIAYKAKRFGMPCNEYALHHPNGTIYLNNAQECLEQIEVYEQWRKEYAEVEGVWDLQHA